MTLSLVNVLLALLALGLLIAAHEFGHFLAARLLRMRVERFSIGFGPPLWRWKRGQTEYAVGWLPLGGYVHVFGMNPAEDGALTEPDSYQRRPLWARAAVCAAGPAASYALGLACYFAFFVGQTAYEKVFHVEEVVPGSPAERGGLRPGDDIGMIDDVRPRSTAEFANALDERRGREVVLRLDRGGTLMAVRVRLPAARADYGLLGIRYREKVQRVPRRVGPLGALAASVRVAYANSAAIVRALGRLFARPSEVEVGGPPEIVRQIKRSVERGIFDFVWLLGGLSVMFGLLNLLPVPALDGSKLLLLGVEGVMRRPLSARFQLVFHGVGFVLLLGVMLVVSLGDILRMVHGG